MVRGSGLLKSLAFKSDHDLIARYKRIFVKSHDLLQPVISFPASIPRCLDNDFDAEYFRDPPVSIGSASRCAPPVLCRSRPSKASTCHQRCRPACFPSTGPIRHNASWLLPSFRIRQPEVCASTKVRRKRPQLHDDSLIRREAIRTPRPESPLADDRSCLYACAAPRLPNCSGRTAPEAKGEGGF